MPTYTWWAIVFLPSNAPGYLKMLDGMCQNIYTDAGVVVDQSQPLEYTCVSTDVAAPSWYNPETNQP